MSLERVYLVVVLNLDFIFSLLERSVDFAPKFPKVGETGSSHPNDEMLIFHVLPLNILPSRTTSRFDVCGNTIYLGVFEFVSQI